MEGRHPKPYISQVEIGGNLELAKERSWGLEIDISVLVNTLGIQTQILCSFPGFFEGLFAHKTLVDGRLPFQRQIGGIPGKYRPHYLAYCLLMLRFPDGEFPYNIPCFLVTLILRVSYSTTSVISPLSRQRTNQVIWARVMGTLLHRR